MDYKYIKPAKLFIKFGGCDWCWCGGIGDKFCWKLYELSVFGVIGWFKCPFCKIIDNSGDFSSESSTDKFFLCCCFLLWLLSILPLFLSSPSGVCSWWSTFDGGTCHHLG